MTKKDDTLLGMNTGWNWTKAPDFKTGVGKHCDIALKPKLGATILGRQPTVVAGLSAESLLIQSPSSGLGEPELVWTVLVRPARGVFFAHLVSPKREFDALRDIFGALLNRWSVPPSLWEQTVLRR